MKKGDWVAVDDWDDVEFYSYVIVDEDNGYYKIHAVDVDPDFRPYTWVLKSKVRLMTDEECSWHKGIMDE